MPPWTDDAEELCRVLEADLRQRGFMLKRAPALPPFGACLGKYIQEPFRVLCVYALDSVVGWDDEAQKPIYGPPVWRLRVDVVVEPAKVQQNTRIDDAASLGS